MGTGACKAKFLTFEGIEGAGKTELLRRLGRRLQELEIPHRLTREPGGTAIGREIRRILLRAEEPHPAVPTELLLYLADRVQHLEELILPALASGVHVLSDRYHDASVAYQGYARGLDISWSDPLTRHLGIRKPDRTFLLDLPAEEGMARVARRNHVTGDKPNRFDSARLEFHRKVREGYLKLAREEPDRFCVVDAARPFDVVYNEVEAAVLALLGTSGEPC
ncbi:MAG: dTMP kinase [Acidobacteriota bacterium]